MSFFCSISIVNFAPQSACGSELKEKKGGRLEYRLPKILL